MRWRTRAGRTSTRSPVRAAPACARITAVDVSPVMLRRPEAKVRDLGLENVDIVHSGFEVLAAERSADGIFAKYLLRAT